MTYDCHYRHDARSDGSEKNRQKNQLMLLVDLTVCCSRSLHIFFVVIHATADGHFVACFFTLIETLPGSAQAAPSKKNVVHATALYPA